MPIDLSDPLFEDIGKYEQERDDAGKGEKDHQPLEAVVLADPVFDAFDFHVTVIA
jgi:hypothetical protein